MRLAANVVRLRITMNVSGKAIDTTQNAAERHEIGPHVSMNSIKRISSVKCVIACCNASSRVKPTLISVSTVGSSEPLRTSLYMPSARSTVVTT